MRVPAGAVLLAAGRGSRLAPLTDHTHKSLLPIAGKPALKHTLDALIACQISDIVVVTGDKQESIESFLAEHYDGRVTVARNDKFAVDTNILSTELGVSALRQPSHGYLIVETDLVVEPDAWSVVLDVGPGAESFWVTRGQYGPNLTGAALHCDANLQVTDLVYAPTYTVAYAGWQKWMGVLYVGPDQVVDDRRFRQEAITTSIAQYYMMPWVHHLSDLPCRAKILDAHYVASFNDLETYEQINRHFTQLLRSQRAP
jgi:CTP:molybdopterin cytidylyltransferase MocA